MRKTIPLALLLATLVLPALADSYPVDGKWGQSSSSDNGAIDCSGKRVITFNGNQRQDSSGGVPAYRNKSVTAEGSSYRVVDQFTSGQISNGSVSYTLRQVDNDHIVMQQQQGGTIKLQRCK
ncbi:MAG TPA: hypothetical protein VFC45_03330 [Pseudolabrys sp.]|nr:hypothetical protein [Pseudolabrys sp.]